MLGEQVGELRGKRTGRRVLSEGISFKVEVSFESTGKLLGSDASEFATYWSVPRPDGTLYGEGQGIVMTKDGDMLTWKGQGIGRFTGGGAVSFRGAIYFSTASPKFARLNSVASIYEHDVDADGNTHSKMWEWK